MLSGHKEAVWAGVIVEGIDCERKEGDRSFLTGESREQNPPEEEVGEAEVCVFIGCAGSADRTLIHWDQEGKPIRNFKGQSRRRGRGSWS